MQIRIEIVAENSKDLEKVIKALQAIERANKRKNSKRKKSTAKPQKTTTKAKISIQSRLQVKPPAKAKSNLEVIINNKAEETKAEAKAEDTKAEAKADSLPDFVKDNPWLSVLAQKSRK